ncbi:MAG: hypothetical protein ACLUOI_03815 [Eisenbergiella sp.]
MGDRSGNTPGTDGVVPGLCPVGKGAMKAICRNAGSWGRECPAGANPFEDTVLLQAKLHRFCFTGAYLAGRASVRDGRGLEECLYLAGKAEKCYRLVDAAMRERSMGNGMVSMPMNA